MRELSSCNIVSFARAIIPYCLDLISVADPDPGSGAFLTPGSGIRYPGWVESQHPDSGSGIRDEQPGS
jgi:hypothetical protein